jgi:hypothetical protein
MGPHWHKGASLLLYILLAVNAYLLVSGTARMAKLETELDDLSENFKAPAVASGELSDKLDYLNTRAHMLTDFIADLEVTLTGLKVTVGSIGDCRPQLATDTKALEIAAVTTQAGDADTPAPVAAADTGDAAGSGPAADDDDRQSEEKIVQPAVASAPVIPEPAARGPWLINLASLDNQPAADRFSTRARTRGIPVEQQVVTVKGQQRWRIQVTGFASADEARINAGSIKEKLGLKNIWITRQR